MSSCFKIIVDFLYELTDAVNLTVITD